MSSAAAARPDIQWPKHPVFGIPLPPSWPSELSVLHLESIARKHLRIASDVPCAITPFAEGGLNKLYTISADSLDREYLIRVALPVEPRWKTLSEVATIEFVRARATELVPRVLAYEANAESSVTEYEWMMIEKRPGGSLEEHWKGMAWEAKVALVKTLVGVLARLHSHPLRGIGNIYPRTSSSDLDSELAPVTGRIVSMLFFWSDHYEQDVARGPFRSSHDWVRACLQFTLNDSSKVLARTSVEDDSDDVDEREEAQITQGLAERLSQLLPRIFPPSDEIATAEPTVVYHGDLSFHNILTDESGQLTGIVDWECVSALPLWRACALPSFLESRTRTERPNVNIYGKDDDGEITELYAEHMLEWEQTQLRAVFLEEMERVQPEWVRMHKDRASVLKRDFHEAVVYCDNEIYRRRVRTWIDQIERVSDEQLRAPSAAYISLKEELMM